MNRRSSSRSLALLAALALAAGAGGCGSGSSSSSSSTAVTTQSTGPTKSKEAAPRDESIEQFGGPAKATDKAAVGAAVHGFLTAMARGDLAGICGGLTKANREQLASFGAGEGLSDCEAALKVLMNPAVASEARRAAAAPVTTVRIKDGTAFALFTPRGRPPSYLVMKRDGDSWKSIGVTPGTPLAPPG